MNYVIKTAKTVNEAVSQALSELNISREDAEIEVIEAESKGLFGLIGSKDATVKVRRKEQTEDILREIFNETETSQPTTYFENNSYSDTESVEDDMMPSGADHLEPVASASKHDTIENAATEFISRIVKELGIEPNVALNWEDDTLNGEILGDEKELGIVIGKRGVTLDSIQYLTGLVVNRHSDAYVRVHLDSSGYRKKREAALVELADKMANKVIRTGHNVKLEPMNAHERKIIHEALQHKDGVITHSEGKDPFRKVIIQKEREY
ncbi:protein jag [Peptoniphilus equinus]|uniref:RNA-binding protein KhpB n=1 Tax=Peptoniphilus equinus TaxID=3016343 RepID=A0ABY7QUE6_9FIRM|nr:RNA-binding cell elongation regulator Jag/EloR [Peptoniphilus equinus]WBW49981.1 protein jag [Peptoniphilus equinus]